ncbi:MAG: translocation/assembly module TamB domain-containing protein [Candidatus Symbiothrix sp.]|jgi:hypothetical protein|nr:translocation/assembly module TamB domain-containing protein [Candidatus Symbiothrix sp.]
MKIFKRIVWGLLLFSAVFYAIPAGLLQTPYFQKNISYKIAHYLENKLKTKVTIRQVELGLFNKLILKDVYLEDQSGDTLFEAKRIAAGFDLLPFFKKKWRFNSLQLFTFHFNLNKETDDSPLNIQYIIDAFAKQDTTQTDNSIDLQINTLSLRSGVFSYCIKSVPQIPDKFNAKNILLKDIFSKIHIHTVTDKNLAIQVNKLGFKEQSGFQVKNIAFDLTADRDSAFINKLSLNLDKSSLSFSDISADYSQINAKGKGLKNTILQFRLMNSGIVLNELTAFVPAFSQFEDKINIEGDFSGNPDAIVIKNLYCRYYNRLMIRANANIRNLFDANPDAIFISGAVEESFFSPEGLERIINNFSKKPFSLPASVKQMENAGFSGEINGFLNHLETSGILNTGIGNIVANVTIGKDKTQFIKGQISSESLRLNKLLNDEKYGEIVFDIHLDAKQTEAKKFSGIVDGNVEKFVYKGYTYNNLNVDGEFSENSFQGLLDLDSSEGKIQAKGLFDFNGENAEFKFTAKATDLQLDKLNLTQKFTNPLLSFDLNADFTGNNPDNLLGLISLTDLQFSSDKGSYFLDSLLLRTTQSEQEKILSIHSEIMRGEIRGNYAFSTVLPAIKRTFAAYLPSLFEPGLPDNKNTENSFTVDITIGDMTAFSTILALPFSLKNQTRIIGEYSDSKDIFNLKVDIPEVKIAGSTIELGRITLQKEKKFALLAIEGTQLQKKNDRIGFNVRMEASNNVVNTSFNWVGNSQKYKGKIDLSALFSKKNHSALQTEIAIHRSELVFNDSVWTLHPAVLLIDSSSIKIDHLQAGHEEQYIKINGAVSHNPQETLAVELNKMDLEYIFKSLNIKSLEFGGLATGYVNAQDIYHTKKLYTHLAVNDFAFNNVVFGDLNLSGNWDDVNQGVMMNGYVYQDDSTDVRISGIIYPVKEELSIHFDARNTNAAFLRKYLNSVTQNLTGSFSGHLHLFGNLNKPTIEGDAFAKNCRFGIEYLNTYYSFTDSVKCFPDEIRIKNVSLFDEKGKAALVNGYVRHHLFDDFRFSANIAFDNFMVFNATKTKNPMFYGTAYGNGTATISGTEDLVNIDVSMQNTDNTRMVLNFMDEPDVMDYDFIRFIPPKVDPVKNKDKITPVIFTPVNLNNTFKTEIRLNLLLNATAQASLEIVTDPLSGDKISGYGTGNMQIQYGTKTPLKVLGNYAIERGKYNFSLQKVVFRNFDIQEGSSVTFTGDPYNAEMDIRANYTVSANLGDLDQQLLEQSARNNIPVNCILQLTGPLVRPSISFDLDLPAATSELNRQVKSYIRTEDMMNRQIVYLLVLGRFYTSPEYTREDSRFNNDLSLLTSTLSAQVSNMLGLLSDKLVGIKFHQAYEGEQTSTEVEVLLSSQLLNNRLIINGNFGYLDNPYLNNGDQKNIPLVGDFDLEYKLTESGEIRLKGYNHYNYRNYESFYSMTPYSMTPKMTQGVGILFRKNFNHFSDLLRKRPPVYLLPPPTVPDSLKVE